jgi:hypothetical protein
MYKTVKGTIGMWKLCLFIPTALLIPFNAINVAIMELSCMVLLSFHGKGGMKEVQLYYIVSYIVILPFYLEHFILLLIYIEMFQFLFQFIHSESLYGQTGSSVKEELKSYSNYICVNDMKVTLAMW